MRLTERKVCYPECDKQGNLTKVDYIDIKDKKMAEEKLCQLEDIEEELGVDLVTLFKALKQGGVYVKSGFTEDTAIKMRSFQICGDVSGITIWSQVRLNAKDYGKIWALTKEELENEIH